MEPGVLVLSIVVGFFGLGSAVLGFIAEGTKLTVSHSIHSELLQAYSTVLISFCGYFVAEI
jgi:hypothetical protein